MLSKAQIDHLENVLFSSTLQDVPAIFGKVLPLLFAELRVMQSALDREAEEFFGHEARPDTGGAGGNSQSHRGGADLLGSRSPVPAPQDARPAHSMAAASPGSQAKRLGATPAGDGVAEGGGAESVVSKGLVTEVGGEIRKRKRGRPPKQRVEADAVLAIESSPKLKEVQ
jgi:hypothetical protein